MSSYELTLQPIRRQRNAVTGRFLKGSTPHNKGLSWDEYMSKEGQERSKRGWSNLDRFRSQNAHLHGGKPKRKVIGLHDDGRLIVFPSIEEAARCRKGHPADIRRCCLDNRSLAVNKRNGKVNTNHKYLGMRFYYEDDIDIWKNKIN